MLVRRPSLPTTHTTDPSNKMRKERNLREAPRKEKAALPYSRQTQTP